MATSVSGKSLAAQTVNDLDSLLQVTNNSITISSGTLSDSLFTQILTDFNSGQALALANAAKQVQSNGVTLTGTTSFLGETGVTITVTVMTSGDFTLTVDLPATDLATLLAPVSGINLPSNFDVPLPETWGIIQKSGGTLTFTAAAKGSIGQVLFQATRTSGTKANWDTVAGIDLNATTLSGVPALKAIKLDAFDSFVGLTDIMMVLSSQNLTDFDFPDIAQFNAPALGSGNIKLPDQASGIVKGLNIYGNLSTSNSKGFQLVANYLKLKLDGSLGITLSVSLPNPETSSKLFLTVKETISSGLTVDGMLGGILQDGEVGAFLTGTALATIQGQPVTFDVEVLVVETGVLIIGSMQNTAPIQFTIQGIKFQIANVALVIGIDDDGVPSLGFAASLDIGKLNGSAAVFFDSTDPKQSMFAAAVSDINLCDVAQTLAGQKNVPAALLPALKKIGVKGLQAFTVPKSYTKPLIAALNNRDLPTIAKFFADRGSITIPSTSDQILLEITKPSSTWYLTDMSQMMHYEISADSTGAVAVALEPQLYCVPQDTQLGTLKFPKGFRVIGELDLYVVTAKVNIDIQGLTGACADVTVSKITIGNATFFALTSADGKTGPQVSIATFTQSAQAQPDKNLQPPHIFISGKLTVLGVDLSSTYLSISEKGVVVAIKQQVSEVLNLSVNGTIGDPDNMKIGGSAVVGLDSNLDLGKLGKARFKDNVTGSLSMGVTKSKAYASMVGSFAFAGLSLKTASITLDVSTKALANIVKTLIPEVTDAVVKALTGSAKVWMNLVKSGTITGVAGVKQIAGVLQSQFKLTATDASKLLSGAGFTVNDIASVLKSVYGLSAKDAAGVLQTGLGVGQAAANTAFKAGGYAASEVSGVFGSLVGDIAGKKAGTAVAKAGQTATAAVVKTGTQAVNDVSKAGSSAINELKKIF